jgi:Leucine-rich repeat (LRR) protein
LSGNLLKSIPGNLPDSIETLILSKNLLSQLPANLPANLLQLELSNNRIRIFQPTWKSGQRIQQLGLQDNCITNSEVSILASGRVVRVHLRDNWNEEIHQFSARFIQRNYRVSKLHRVLRQRARLRKVKEELFEIAYHPDIIGRWNIPDGWTNWQH